MILRNFTDSHRNNFNLLRLFAALLVLHSHSYALAIGQGTPDLLGRYLPGEFEGSLGVKIFFVISGFLVTKSFVTGDNTKAFIAARMLRIYPGLIMAVLASILLAFLSTSLAATDFFLHPETRQFFLTNITAFHVRFNLPGAFANNVYPNAVNGSLWTLPTEMTMYLLCVLLGMAGILKERVIFNATLMLIGMVAYFNWQNISIFHQTDQLIHASACFGLGAAAYLNRDFLALRLRWGALALLLTALMWNKPFGQAVYFLSLSYWVLLVAYHPRLQITWPPSIGDYSYGLYIYAYPVQQIIAYWFAPPSATAMFALSFVGTLLFAVPSWHFIEKPCLRLKSRFRFTPPAATQ